MPSKEHCKRNRETKLHAAALDVPKLGSFGFKKITQESVQDSNTHGVSEGSQATNSSSNFLPENECELDVEIPTSPGLTTYTKQAGTESKTNNDMRMIRFHWTTTPRIGLKQTTTMTIRFLLLQPFQYKQN